MNQEEIAKNEMIEWLSFPGELGKVPYKISCTRKFEHFGLIYYIFKFKKNLFSSWKISVCGGYEADSIEHCGHIFSEFKAYNAATELEDATAMVDWIRNYWKQRVI